MTIGLAAALCTSLPAGADDTTTTFSLTQAGGLSVSVPASANLGSAATNAGTLTASLGTVTVTDLRGALGASWTATVSTTAFTTGLASAAESIGKANVRYWSGAATATSGVAVLTPGQLTALLAQPLDVSRTAFSAAATAGNNSASWNPTVIVSVPASAVVGTYTGTITHSVA